MSDQVLNKNFDDYTKTEDFNRLLEVYVNNISGNNMINAERSETSPNSYNISVNSVELDEYVNNTITGYNYAQVETISVDEYTVPTIYDGMNVYGKLVKEAYTIGGEKNISLSFSGERKSYWIDNRNGYIKCTNINSIDYFPLNYYDSSGKAEVKTKISHVIGTEEITISLNFNFNTPYLLFNAYIPVLSHS